MRRLALPGDHADDGGFRPRTMAVLLVVGIAAFVGSLLLGAYAPDLDFGARGGSHAMSKAATGYAAIIDMARATGHDVKIARDPAGWNTDALVIVTPETGRADVGTLLQARRGRPTLMVLPKWQTQRDEAHRGWVTIAGLLPVSEPIGVLAPGTILDVRRLRSGGRRLSFLGQALPSPRPLQVMAAPTLRPIVVDAAGHAVVAQIAHSSTFVLSDPDFLSSHGVERPDRARAALALIDRLNGGESRRVVFDVTTNDLSGGRNSLRLMFEPPFLAMTIAVAAAMALAGWQALVRFGASRPRGRAIAFGKAALIENSAALVERAGRERTLGRRYAALVRERARRAFGIPERLNDTDVDAHLDRLTDRPRFTELVAAASRATQRDEVLAAAQALHRWQKRGSV